MNKSSMNNRDDNDWLDKMLAGGDDYIHDDGFTERVMQGLPARRRSGRMRLLIFGCTGLLCAASLMLSTPGLESLYADWIAFLETQSLYTLYALSLAVYGAASAFAWWLLNPDS